MYIVSLSVNKKNLLQKNYICNSFGIKSGGTCSVIETDQTKSASKTSLSSTVTNQPNSGNYESVQHQQHHQSMYGNSQSTYNIHLPHMQQHQPHLPSQTTISHGNNLQIIPSNSQQNMQSHAISHQQSQHNMHPQQQHHYHSAVVNQEVTSSSSLLSNPSSVVTTSSQPSSSSSISALNHYNQIINPNIPVTNHTYVNGYPSNSGGSGASNMVAQQQQQHHHHQRNSVNMVPTNSLNPMSSMTNMVMGPNALHNPSSGGTSMKIGGGHNQMYSNRNSIAPYPTASGRQTQKRNNQHLHHHLQQQQHQHQHQLHHIPVQQQQQNSSSIPATTSISPHSHPHQHQHQQQQQQQHHHQQMYNNSAYNQSYNNMPLNSSNQYGLRNVNTLTGDATFATSYPHHQQLMHQHPHYPSQQSLGPNSTSYTMRNNQSNAITGQTNGQIVNGNASNAICSLQKLTPPYSSPSGGYYPSIAPTSSHQQLGGATTMGQMQQTQTNVNNSYQNSTIVTNITPPLTPGANLRSPYVSPPGDVKQQQQSFVSDPVTTVDTKQSNNEDIRITLAVRDGIILSPFRLEHNLAVSNHIFHLKTTVHQTLKTRPDLELQLKCFHHEDRQMYTNWPASVQVTVNNTPLVIDRGENKTSHKPLYLKDVSLAGRNTIQINVSACCCSHLFVLQIVHRPTIRSVIQGIIKKKLLTAVDLGTAKIKSFFSGINDATTAVNSATGKQSQNDSPDPKEHAIDSLPIDPSQPKSQPITLKVSLKCPLSLHRIQFPARGADCKHLQCFDLESFLNFNRDRGSWRCLVCNKPTQIDDIEVDQYTWGILNSASLDVDEVAIDSVANWRPIKYNSSYSQLATVAAKTTTNQTMLDDDIINETTSTALTNSNAIQAKKSMSKAMSPGSMSYPNMMNTWDMKSTTMSPFATPDMHTISSGSMMSTKNVTVAVTNVTSTNSSSSAVVPTTATSNIKNGIATTTSSNQINVYDFPISSAVTTSSSSSMNLPISTIDYICPGPLSQLNDSVQNSIDALNEMENRINEQMPRTPHTPHPPRTPSGTPGVSNHNNNSGPPSVTNITSIHESNLCNSVGTVNSSINNDSGISELQSDLNFDPAAIIDGDGDGQDLNLLPENVDPLELLSYLDPTNSLNTPPSSGNSSNGSGNNISSNTVTNDDFLSLFD